MNTRPFTYATIVSWGIYLPVLVGSFVVALFAGAPLGNAFFVARCTACLLFFLLLLRYSYVEREYTYSRARETFNDSLVGYLLLFSFGFLLLPAVVVENFM